MYVEAHEMVTEYLVRNAFERLHTLGAKGVDFMKPRIKRDFIVDTDCMKVGALLNFFAFTFFHVLCNKCEYYLQSEDKSVQIEPISIHIRNIFCSIGENMKRHRILIPRMTIFISIRNAEGKH